MTKRQRIWLISSLCFVGVVMIGLIVAFQPYTARHLGYALPGSDGLPDRLYYHSRVYSSINAGLCFTAANARDAGDWPLRQIGALPTLFGAPHAMWENPTHLWPGDTPVTIYITNDANCYAKYGILGGP